MKNGIPDLFSEVRVFSFSVKFTPTSTLRHHPSPRLWVTRGFPLHQKVSGDKRGRKSKEIFPFGEGD